MADITSRPFRPSPTHACSACVFGQGPHEPWCRKHIPVITEELPGTANDWVRDRYMKARADFLGQHANASEIVVDTETGMPVKAVYIGPDCTGNHRTHPAVFWFDPLPPPETH